MNAGGVLEVIKHKGEDWVRFSDWKSQSDYATDLNQKYCACLDRACEDGDRIARLQRENEELRTKYLAQADKNDGLRERNDTLTIALEERQASEQALRAECNAETIRANQNWQTAESLRVELYGKCNGALHAKCDETITSLGRERDELVEWKDRLLRENQAMIDDLDCVEAEEAKLRKQVAELKSELALADAILCREGNRNDALNAAKARIEDLERMYDGQIQDNAALSAELARASARTGSEDFVSRTEYDALDAEHKNDVRAYEAELNELGCKYEELVAYTNSARCVDAAKLAVFNRIVTLAAPYIEEAYSKEIA